MNRRNMKLLISAALLIGLAGLIFFFLRKINIQVPNFTFQEKVSVTRSLDGTYRLHFSDAGPWTVYIGRSPDKIDWDNPYAEVEDTAVKFEDIKYTTRMFFGIKGQDSMSYVVSERRIPLKGQVNFRDLGGIRTQDGRYVKWGTIYRSGKLSNLKKGDLQYFNSLGIKAVMDFRNDIEVNKDPNFSMREDVLYMRIPIGDKEGEEYDLLLSRVKSGKIRGRETKKEFIYIMKQFADTLAKDFEPLIEYFVANKDLNPFLYHCSGGKDRTGFATALLLSALGVERQTIIDEYLMSNYYRYDLNRRNVRLARLIGIDPETSQYAFLVNEDYIGAAFEVIDTQYGGMDLYLEKKFGLTADVRKELKERYTF